MISGAEGFISRESFRDRESAVSALLQGVDELCRKVPGARIRSGGISTAGLLSADGAFLRLNNLPFLEGVHLPRMLEEHTGVPWGIANDAHCGALSEWAGQNRELLYWVLGGGWGGAWITAEGKILGATLDWDGNDESIKSWDEPGYAIGIPKSRLRELLDSRGFPLSSAGFDAAWHASCPELYPGILTGPGGSPDSIRSEFLVSGTGRYRIYRFLHHAAASGPQLPPGLDDPGSAGKILNDMSASGDVLALLADHILGTCMGWGAIKLLDDIGSLGRKTELPIVLAGKPAWAAPYFRPALMQVLGEAGYRPDLEVSASLPLGTNPNLQGAAVLARTLSGM